MFISMNRREFVGRAGTIGLAALAAHELSSHRAVAKQAVTERDEFCCFTESFQGSPIPDVCRKFREIGLDGLDLTVRPGGHIQPENVAKELPTAVAAAKTHGVRISMLTTSVNDDDKISEQVIATAGNLGIAKIKLGYMRYRTFRSLLKEIDEARERLERISKLARKHHVLPCVHIHSGDMIPGSGAVAYLLLRDFSPEDVGAYVDPMHMTIEGGSDGWRQGLDLLTPWIAISSLKNFIWEPTERDAAGQQRWRIVKCPLADGMAPLPDYLAVLRKVGYRGVFTLHSEYSDRNSWKNLNADECLQQTARDLAYARKLLATT